MGLVEFLNARQDEDERIARQGLHGHHPVRDWPDDEPADYWTLEAMAARDAAASDWTKSWHTHDCGWRVGEGIDDECICGVPQRILDEVAAKRELIRVAEEAKADADEHLMLTGRELPDPEASMQLVKRAKANALLMPLIVLAQTYAGHPDFDPSWKAS